MKTLTRGVNTVTQRQYTKMKKKSVDSKIKRLIRNYVNNPCVLIPREERTELKIEPLSPSQVSELKGEIKLIKSKRPAVTGLLNPSEVSIETCPNYNPELKHVAKQLHEELPKMTREILEKHKK